MAQAKEPALLKTATLLRTHLLPFFRSSRFFLNNSSRLDLISLRSMPIVLIYVSAAYLVPAGTLERHIRRLEAEVCHPYPRKSTVDLPQYP